MTKDTGGPAFPTYGSDGSMGPGMDLRDYFAAKALQGWLAGSPADQPIHDEAIAARCYRIADAMLAERAK